MSTTIAQTVDQTWINQAIDHFYSKMLDDYRINRFFSNKPMTEQAKALKKLVQLALAKAEKTQLHAALDEFFTQAFARSNHKPSLVTGHDFGFLLDIVGGTVPPKTYPLCDAHNFLLKMAPDDDHYDIVLSHLNATLQEIAAPSGLEAIKLQVLKLAEQARDPVLGRNEEPA